MTVEGWGWGGGHGQDGEEGRGGRKGAGGGGWGGWRVSQGRRGEMKVQCQGGEGGPGGGRGRGWGGVKIDSRSQWSLRIALPQEILNSSRHFELLQEKCSDHWLTNNF